MLVAAEVARQVPTVLVELALTLLAHLLVVALVVAVVAVAQLVLQAQPLVVTAEMEADRPRVALVVRPV